MRALAATFLAAAATLLASALPTPAAAEELVVIVNAANPNSALTAQQVKSFFMKRTGTWQNGEKVRPVDREGESAERKAFLAQALGLTSDDLKRYWIEKQYQTADQPPASVPDDASVLKFVSFFKGGIGFVTKSALGKGEGVKVVLTLSY
jgi:ABC-type phosphate transport system substrate-binding protein